MHLDQYQAVSLHFEVFRQDTDGVAADQELQEDPDYCTVVVLYAPR
jgi:hypothetical protein